MGVACGRVQSIQLQRHFFNMCMLQYKKKQEIEFFKIIYTSKGPVCTTPGQHYEMN